jgi:hypothetical protein
MCLKYPIRQKMSQWVIIVPDLTSTAMYVLQNIMYSEQQEYVFFLRVTKTYSRC